MLAASIPDSCGRSCSRRVDYRSVCAVGIFSWRAIQPVGAVARVWDFAHKERELCCVRQFGTSIFRQPSVFGVRYRRHGAHMLPARRNLPAHVGRRNAQRVEHEHGRRKDLTLHVSPAASTLTARCTAHTEAIVLIPATSFPLRSFLVPTPTSKPPAKRSLK